MAYLPLAHFDTTMFASTIPQGSRLHAVPRPQAVASCSGPLEVPLSPPFFGKLSPACLLLSMVVSRSWPVFPDYVVGHLFSTIAAAVDPACRLTSQPTLRLWAESVITKARCRSSTVLVALSYLDRARTQMRVQMGSWAIEWAFIGALILANKVMFRIPSRPGVNAD
jgi:hypothetical protein